ncbi:MAG: HEAT repeat domain-containing protein [Anaerolineaceae bacterium]
MQKENTIAEVIQALLDTEKAFPANLLYAFSDLEPRECSQLLEIWGQIPLQRRRALLEDLSEMADRDNLMLFEEVGRIALEDSDPQVKVSAIDLLFQADDTRLLPRFLSLLKDNESEDVRAAAANVLGPYVCLGEYDRIHANVLRRVENALLQAYHEDASELVRRRALESLGYSSSEEVPELLRAACARPETAWLESALFAMGKSADEQWKDIVLAHLKDDNLPVRLQAVHAAGELALADARAALLRVLDREFDIIELRREAIWALSQIGGEGVENALERLLERVEDDEDIDLLEEALDQLNFTEEKETFNLLDMRLDEDAGAESFLGLVHEDEEGWEGHGYDPQEWNAYTSDEDFGLDLEDEDDLDDDEFDDDDLL